MSTLEYPYSPIDRLNGLTPEVRRLARSAQHWLERGEPAQATEFLDGALRAAPRHPELLRLCGLFEHFQNRHDNAVALFRKAAVAWPEDGLVESNLGAALAQRGDIDAALRAFVRATELDPTMMDAWFNLGRALELRHDAAGAHAAFSAVLEIEPNHHPARILRAEALKTMGRIDEAKTELRHVLRDDPASVAAWVALINLKSAGFDVADADQLQLLYRHAALGDNERIDIGFAYASVLEAAARYAEAFDVLVAVNAAKRRTLRWSASAVSALIDDILAAFAADFPQPEVASHGGDIIFLVGMPRSGSTLAEQILAAHPGVCGGGETGFLAQILQAESERRGVRFPLWIPDATGEDWSRLRDIYLARIAPLRTGTLHFTDKTLTTWQTLGAVRRMLPGARIVHCRRDPVETTWSCYKHNFSNDQLYSYDLQELAAFYHDEARALRFWHAQYPRWIHEHRYEALLAEPEATVRSLLAHCGLDFDPACLKFHDAKRDVRTTSAAQVRQPLRADTAVTAHYGALLDPLRAALSGIE